MNLKRTIPSHILIKISKVKDKERILKAVSRKQLVTHKGISIRLWADFSAETLQAKIDWQDVFKVLKRENTTKYTLPGKVIIQN